MPAGASCEAKPSFLTAHPAPPPQVSFDEKSPTELLQLLNDVFAELDKAHRVDVRDEPPEVAAPRMINFLHVIKFPLPPDVCVPGSRGIAFRSVPVVILAPLAASRLAPPSCEASAARSIPSSPTSLQSSRS